jgi:hypothetical protein
MPECNQRGRRRAAIREAHNSCFKADSSRRLSNGHVEISDRRFICEDPEGDMA